MCPNRFELLHPVYRKLCHLLADVDEWGQMAMLAALQRYVRSHFTNPQRGSSNAGGSSKPAQDPSQPSKKVSAFLDPSNRCCHNCTFTRFFTRSRCSTLRVVEWKCWQSTIWCKLLRTEERGFHGVSKFHKALAGFAQARDKWDLICSIRCQRYKAVTAFPPCLIVACAPGAMCV